MSNNRKEHFLVILDGSNEIREVNLNAMRRARISFGRDSSNQIVLVSNIVSKLHGFFEFVNDTLVVYDAGSTNGFYVNGKMYRRDARGESEIHRMREGDIIRIDNLAGIQGHKMGVLMVYTTRKSVGGWKKTEIYGQPQLTVGRDRNCGIWLDNIKVSRRHAVILQNRGGCFIRDLHSANGVFVNGTRVRNDVMLHEKDIIFIANSMLIFTSGMLIYKTDIGGTRVVMRNISRTVKYRGKPRRILNDVNLTVEPNEFIAIIGGSGAGKSTVMNAMSGFEQATQGSVFVNDTDLYKNYQVLKNIIGYVPQQDIIYENITLKKMLEYSARMRMSNDVSKQERDARVDEVLRMVELTEHKDKYIRSLSGGQKKRASIAVELLADPGLFFLDEPTSGLDPGTEATLMRTLNSLSKQKGKTIIMVTHTTQNLHLCDKILFMGNGGRVCFYGSPPDCMSFFGVDNLTEIYNKVITEQEAVFWAQKYMREYGINNNNGGKSSTPEKGKKASFLKQLGILSARYMTLIKNDTQRLMMIFLQPIIIALLIALVADENVFEQYASTRSILFAVSCAGIWVGLFSSIQEICKERSILKREYMANLRLGAYVLSKFAVQLLLSIIQSAIMILIFYLTVGNPEDALLTENGFFEMFMTMLLTIFSSSAIGLVVSSLSKNSDKAMTVAPFLLIIQLLFSGILFELEGATEKISYLTVSKWSVASFGSISNLNAMTEGVPGIEAEDIFDFTVRHMTNTWLILLAFTAVCFTASILILRNVKKDSR